MVGIKRDAGDRVITLECRQLPWIDTHAHAPHAKGYISDTNVDFGDTTYALTPVTEVSAAQHETPRLRADVAILTKAETAPRSTRSTE